MKSNKRKKKRKIVHSESISEKHLLRLRFIVLSVVGTVVVVVSVVVVVVIIVMDQTKMSLNNNNGRPWRVPDTRLFFECSTRSLNFLSRKVSSSIWPDVLLLVHWSSQTRVHNFSLCVPKPDKQRLTSLLTFWTDTCHEIGQSAIMFWRPFTFFFHRNFYGFFVTIVVNISAEKISRFCFSFLGMDRPVSIFPDRSVGF